MLASVFDNCSTRWLPLNPPAPVTNTFYFSRIPDSLFFINRYLLIPHFPGYPTALSLQ